MPLTYTSATSIGSNVNDQIFYPKSLRNSNSTSETLASDEYIALKITTPLFYALLARDPDPATFISSSVQPPSPHPFTFHVSHPAIFASLFSLDQLPVPPSPKSSASATTPAEPFPTVSRTRWSLLARLRRNPHPLDQHSTRLPLVLKRQYRIAVLKLLLWKTFFFGLPVILDLSNAAVKIALCWLHASVLLDARRYELPGNMGGEVAPDRTVAERAVWMELLGLVGIHIWRLLSMVLGVVV